MKSLLKSKYVTSAIFYTGTSGLLALLPLLLLPVITSHISASGYGVYVTYVLICKVMCSIVSLGYIECLAREFSCQSTVVFSKYYTNALYNVTVWSLAVFIIICVLSINLSYNMDIPNALIPAICIIAYFQYIINSVLSIFQMSSRPALFGAVKMALFLLEYGMVILLICFKDISHFDLIYAYLLSHITVVSACVYFLFKRKLVQLDTKPRLFDPNLRASLPLVPHEIGGLILSFSDRFMINHFIGTAAVAIYAIGYQFGQVVSLVDTAVNKAWIPWLYKELQKSNIAKKRIVWSCLAYVFALIVFSLFVSYLSSYVIDAFYPSEYEQSREVVIYIAFAFVIFGIYKVFAGFLFFYKKTAFLGLATVVTVFINVLLSAHLVPAYGIVGAAYSTLISFSSLCLFVFIYLYFLVKQRSKFDSNVL